MLGLWNWIKTKFTLWFTQDPLMVAAIGAPFGFLFTSSFLGGVLSAIIWAAVLGFLVDRYKSSKA